jgi:hypothetical protein
VVEVDVIMDSVRHEALSEERLARALGRALPRAIARTLAMEWVIARSAFAWRGAAPTAREGERSFAYATESPLHVLLMVYPLLVAGDALVLWVVLPPRLAYVHVVAAALGVYGFVWLLGVYRTLVARPHVVDGAYLHVHRGILGSARIPLAEVETAVTLPEGDVEPPPDAAGRSAHHLDVQGRRVLLVLRKAAACTGYLGAADARRIVVSATEPDGLRRALVAGA